MKEAMTIWFGVDGVCVLLNTFMGTTLLYKEGISYYYHQKQVKQWTPF
jgi:sRNA-binding regulator protein Hfq